MGNSSGEYQTMIRSIAALKEGFRTDRTAEQSWTRRASRALALMVGLLQEHCELAEKPGGLISDVELRLGRNDEITRARREHDGIMHDAVALLADLEEELRTGTGTRPDLLRRARALTKALRVHTIRQADLLLEKYDRDLGVPD